MRTTGRLERGDGLVEGIGVRQQRHQVNAAAVDEVDGEGELGVEAEGAADVHLLGDDEVLRDGDVAAEAELDEDAART